MNCSLQTRMILSAIAMVMAAQLLTGCTTLRNRRDLYFPPCVWGPYTKMLHHGIPKPTPVQGAAPAGSSGKNVVRPQG